MFHVKHFTPPGREREATRPHGKEDGSDPLLKLPAGSPAAPVPPGAGSRRSSRENGPHGKAQIPRHRDRAPSTGPPGSRSRRALFSSSLPGTAPRIPPRSRSRALAPPPPERGASSVGAPIASRRAPASTSRTEGLGFRRLSRCRRRRPREEASRSPRAARQNTAGSSPPPSGTRVGRSSRKSERAVGPAVPDADRCPAGGLAGRRLPGRLEA